MMMYDSMLIIIVSTERIPCNDVIAVGKGNVCHKSLGSSGDCSHEVLQALDVGKPRILVDDADKHVLKIVPCCMVSIEFRDRQRWQLAMEGLASRMGADASTARTSQRLPELLEHSLGTLFRLRLVLHEIS
uniref:Uncharacterized protein n=1 Tax=Lutzomyia longipalpis TaxID=7200 RepID=A0A1B0GJD0_LUTLO